MKLYHRISRFCFRKHVHKGLDKHIKWALKLKRGDMVNDCTGFNRYVIEVEPEKYYGKKGWYIYSVDFTVSDDPNATEGGGCSLTHCGVCPPLPREECEKEALKFLEYWLSDPKAGAAYYGGLDNPEYKKEIEMQFKKRDVLRAGGHISDEKGVMLPEFHAHL